MSYTAWSTVVVGQVATAAWANLYIGDNISYLHGDAGTLIQVDDGILIAGTGFAGGNQFGSTHPGGLELAANGPVTLALTDWSQASPAGRWQIYQQADVMRVWRNSVGDRVTVDASGNLYAARNGYTIGSDSYAGVRVRWGSGSTNGSGIAAVTFSSAFPGGVLAAVAACTLNNATYGISVNSLSMSGFTAYGNGSVGFYYIALGV